MTDLETRLPAKLPSEIAAGGDKDGELTRRVDSEISRLKAFNDPKGIYARLPEEISIR